MDMSANVSGISSKLWSILCEDFLLWCGFFSGVVCFFQEPVLFSLLMGGKTEK